MRSSLFMKLTALALAALMVLPLASCATTDETPDDTTADTSADTTAGTVAGTSDDNADDNSSSDNTSGTTDAGAATDPTTDAVTEPETDDLNYECDLPNNLSYKNAQVNILYIKAPGRSDELISEKLGAGAVSDSVFERNTIVETQLGVKFNFIPQDDDVPGQATVERTMTSGDKSYDIFTLGTNWSTGCAIKGCYLDLNEVEYIDLGKHYWSQDYNKVMTFTSDNKQFLATSPAAISLFRLTYLTIYNRDLFNDYGFADLYDVVKEGEWTLDYQKNLIADIWTDKDGDNLPTENDFYGFVTGTCISIDPYTVSSDITLISLDENGYLWYDESQIDKMVEMADKVSALYNVKGTYCFPQSEQDRIGLNNIMGKFARKEALMVTTQFLSMETNIEALAAMNYGIVPLPKLSVEQKDYNTFVQDQVTSFGISATITDLDRVSMLGAVMEALAYHSNVTVRPAYYDSTLSLRFMQDPESRTILDTMFETISFDYCFICGAGSIRDDLRTRLSKESHGVASRGEAWRRGVNRQLEKDNAKLDELP